MDYFKKTMDPVERVMHDAKIAKNDVDEIVLVRGFSEYRFSEYLSSFSTEKSFARRSTPMKPLPVVPLSRLSFFLKSVRIFLSLFLGYLLVASFHFLLKDPRI
jgi:hypothetical protein